MIILQEDELKTVGKVKQNTLIRGDCLNVMPYIADGSIDAIITDLPYGTTACKWDSVIPIEPMWQQVKRVLRPRGAFVTTASQPFTSMLVVSNLKWFKYEWIWNKHLAGNGILSDIQPLKIHENCIVFCDGATTYNQQKSKGNGRYKGGITDNHGTFSGAHSEKVWSDEYKPISILDFSGAGMRNYREHPTQKPVALYEYLIRTYTNPGDTVLDICCGSGTTIVAAIQTGRNAIGIEKDSKYFEIAQRRAQETEPLLFTEKPVTIDDAKQGEINL